jgi:hypothetical protein
MMIESPAPGTSTRACMIHPIDSPFNGPCWVVSSIPFAQSAVAAQANWGPLSHRTTIE